MIKNRGFINSGIDAYVKNAKQRFHTPGHKGLLDKNDITEIDEQFPAEFVLAAQKKAAQIYGAERVRFLTLGSSVGNKAAIIALSRLAADGKSVKVLCESGCHQSVLDGITLSGGEAVIVENTVSNGLNEPLTALQIEKTLKKNPSIRAAVLTSPDYYGINAKTEAAKIIKESGRYLHIDAAHGAHYPLRGDLFSNEIFAFADSAVFSAHKTLPAYTQSSLLAIYNGSAEKEFDRCLSLLGTSSPSYTMLAGIENAVDYAKANAKNYDALKAVCTRFRSVIKCAAGDDFTRLTVDAFDLGLSGLQLYQELKKAGITAEKYDRRYTVFIITVCDDPKSIIKLANIINSLRIKK